MLRKPEEQSAATAEQNKPIIQYMAISNTWCSCLHKSNEVSKRNHNISFQKYLILPDGIET